MGALLVTAAGCTGAIPRVDAQVVATARGRGYAGDPGRLESGRDLYVRRCGSCHSLHAPAEQDPAGWTKVLVVMGRKARLDADQSALVLDYLQATAR